MYPHPRVWPCFSCIACAGSAATLLRSGAHLFDPPGSPLLQPSASDTEAPMYLKSSCPLTECGCLVCWVVEEAGAPVSCKGNGELGFLATWRDGELSVRE